jgi:hypothetical protein
LKGKFGGKRSGGRQAPLPLQSTSREFPPGIGLLPPNRGLEELSAKPGGLILNAWNSEKFIAFFENPWLLFRLKVKKFQNTVFGHQPSGWRIISTNLLNFSIIGDEALTK